MSTELIAFLRARLDEDEAVARATTERQPYDQWDAVGDDREGETARKHWSVVKIARMELIPAARDLADHIARHDPASVLRDIESKRQIVRIYEDALRAARVAKSDTRVHDLTTGAAATTRAVVRLLALPYADHPGYEEAWRP